jgi:hypothetical protein
MSLTVFKEMDGFRSIKLRQIHVPYIVVVVIIIIVVIRTYLKLKELSITHFALLRLYNLQNGLSYHAVCTKPVEN